MTLTTDSRWHELLGWHDLTDLEKEDQDMGDAFFRYHGVLYAVSEFARFDAHGGQPAHGVVECWHAHYPMTAFSSVVLKLSSDGESYQVGMVKS